jgi:protein-S-isoprenylcysteine O-methyltransferase Ste14
MPEGRAANSRPVSISTTWINFAGVGSFAAVVMLLTTFRVQDTGYRLLFVLASITVPVLVLERLFTDIGLRGKFPLDWSTAKLARVATKLFGVVASWLLVLLIYWVFPYFRESTKAFYDLLNLVWLPTLVLAPIYLWYVDSLLDDPKDEYLAFGRLFTGQWSQIDPRVLGNHIRAWLVKLFFLQFILEILANRLNAWLTADLKAHFLNHPYGFLDIYVDALFLVDMAFGAVGYLLTLRLFDTHVRTTEPTLLGWVVCLICYAPFSTILNYFAQYDDDLYWGGWLAGYPTISLLWAAMIAICTTIFVLATVQLGIRFGNLSHRGIVTNGIYGWLKHPAYVSKILSWWLISVPFVSTNGATEAIRLSLILLCLNVIFYLRAKTEERHLARDPVYRDYLAWMRQNGFGAQLKYAGEVVATTAMTFLRRTRQARPE